MRETRVLCLERKGITRGQIEGHGGLRQGGQFYLLQVSVTDEVFLSPLEA